MIVKFSTLAGGVFIEDVGADERRPSDRTMKINRKSQIARVIAAQGLTPVEASEQVSGRIYEANEYLKRRRGQQA